MACQWFGVIFAVRSRQLEAATMQLGDPEPVTFFVLSDPHQFRAMKSGWNRVNMDEPEYTIYAVLLHRYIIYYSYSSIFVAL